jgi:hypothetical protein
VVAEAEGAGLLGELFSVSRPTVYRVLERARSEIPNLSDRDAT